MRGKSRFNPTRYRRERLVALERRVEFLEAELHRSDRLLGLALEVAVGGSAVEPTVLLNVLCELDRDNPARAAFFDERGSR